MSRRLWGACAVALSAAVLVGCWLPEAQLPTPTATGPDWLLHLSAFFLLGLAWHRALRDVPRVVLVGVALIVLTEGGQALMEQGRTAEWWDAAADLVGHLAGLATSVVWLPSAGDEVAH